MSTINSHSATILFMMNCFLMVLFVIAAANSNPQNPSNPNSNMIPEEATSFPPSLDNPAAMNFDVDSEKNQKSFELAKCTSKESDSDMSINIARRKLPGMRICPTEPLKATPPNLPQNRENSEDSRDPCSDQQKFIMYVTCGGPEVVVIQEFLIGWVMNCIRGKCRLYRLHFPKIVFLVNSGFRVLFRSYLLSHSESKIPSLLTAWSYGTILTQTSRRILSFNAGKLSLASAEASRSILL